MTVLPEEIQKLLGLGIELIPALADARSSASSPARDRSTYRRVRRELPDEVSRNFALLDHDEKEGIGGFISIVGGKLTTYRLMAKATADLVCKKLGIDEECRTDTTPLQEPADHEVVYEAEKLLPAAAVEKARRRLGVRLARMVSAIHANPLLGLRSSANANWSRARSWILPFADAAVPALTIGDVGRRTRLGFGPCQETFCGYKAMLAGYQNQKWSAAEASELLQIYLSDRWKGQESIPTGKQAEQLCLSKDIFGPPSNIPERIEVATHER